MDTRSQDQGYLGSHSKGVSDQPWYWSSPPSWGCQVLGRGRVAAGEKGPADLHGLQAHCSQGHGCPRPRREGFARVTAGLRCPPASSGSAPFRKAAPLGPWPGWAVGSTADRAHWALGTEVWGPAQILPHLGRWATSPQAVDAVSSRLRGAPKTTVPSCPRTCGSLPSISGVMFTAWAHHKARIGWTRI